METVFILSRLLKSEEFLQGLSSILQIVSHFLDGCNAQEFGEGCINLCNFPASTETFVRRELRAMHEHWF